MKQESPGFGRGECQKLSLNLSPHFDLRSTGMPLTRQMPPFCRVGRNHGLPIPTLYANVVESAL